MAGSFILAHSRGCAAAFPRHRVLPDSGRETHDIHIGKAQADGCQGTGAVDFFGFALLPFRLERRVGSRILQAHDGSSVDDWEKERRQLTTLYGDMADGELEKLAGRGGVVNGCGEGRCCNSSYHAAD